MSRLNELVREAKRARGELYPYNTSLVHEICRDITQLQNHVINDTNHNNNEESEPGYSKEEEEKVREAINLNINLTQKTSKRALRIYHYPRAERVKLRYWAAKTLKKSAQKKLATQETELFQTYSEISNRYSEEFMDGLDLGSSLMPPKDLMTSARVVENRGGSILTD
ncbi:2884_t:CDS:1, partial [Ambispora gerdemannii]